MKISPAHTFLQTSGAFPSLEERLADSLAEIARLIALVEEQTTFVDLRESRRHQWIDLLKHLTEVVHCLMLEGCCSRCGKLVKGHVPAGYETGYGLNLNALIATLNAGRHDGELAPAPGLSAASARRAHQRGCGRQVPETRRRGH